MKLTQDYNHWRDLILEDGTIHSHASLEEVRALFSCPSQHNIWHQIHKNNIIIREFGDIDKTFLYGRDFENVIQF